MAADLNLAYLFSFRGDKVETKQLKGASLLYIFLNKETYLCNNSEFSCRIYVFVERHKDLCFYRGRLTQTGSPLFPLVP